MLRGRLEITFLTLLSVCFSFEVQDQMVANHSRTNLQERFDILKQVFPLESFYKSNEMITHSKTIISNWAKSASNSESSYSKVFKSELEITTGIVREPTQSIERDEAAKTSSSFSSYRNLKESRVTAVAKRSASRLNNKNSAKMIPVQTHNPSISHSHKDNMEVTTTAIRILTTEVIAEPKIVRPTHETLKTTDSDRPSLEDYRRIELLLEQLLHKEKMRSSGSDLIMNESTHYDPKSSFARETFSINDLAWDTKEHSMAATQTEAANEVIGKASSELKVGTKSFSSILNSPLTSFSTETLSSTSYIPALPKENIQYRAKNIMNKGNPSYEISLKPQFKEHDEEYVPMDAVVPYSKPKFSWHNMAAKNKDSANVKKTLSETTKTSSYPSVLTTLDNPLSEIRKLYVELKEVIREIESEVEVGMPEESDNKISPQSVSETQVGVPTEEQFKGMMVSSNSPFATFPSAEHIKDFYRKHQEAYKPGGQPSRHLHRFRNKTHYHKIKSSMLLSGADKSRIQPSLAAIILLLVFAWST